MARILVVDDEGDIRALVGRSLSSVGHIVDLAKDGDEALAWMSDVDYDLIILDVMMPNKSGLEVLRDMKKQDRLRGVPVMLFSALGTGTRMMLIDKNQADDYMQKPFMVKEFLRRVKKLIK